MTKEGIGKSQRLANIIFRCCLRIRLTELSVFVGDWLIPDASADMCHCTWGSWLSQCSDLGQVILELCLGFHHCPPTQKSYAFQMPYGKMQWKCNLSFLGLLFLLLSLFLRKRPWCWERLKAGGEGMTEDEMIGWHYRLNGREFEQAPKFGDGQWSLACCSPRGHKELDTTEQLNWTISLELLLKF